MVSGPVSPKRLRALGFRSYPDFRFGSDGHLPTCDIFVFGAEKVQLWTNVLIENYPATSTSYTTCLIRTKSQVLPGISGAVRKEWPGLARVRRSICDTVISITKSYIYIHIFYQLLNDASQWLLDHLLYELIHESNNVYGSGLQHFVSGIVWHIAWFPVGCAGFGGARTWSKGKGNLLKHQSKPYAPRKTKNCSPQ